MALETAWYIPYRVIEARLTGHLTAAGAQEIVDSLVCMLTEAQTIAPGKLCYFIFDTREAKSVPPIYLMMKQSLPVLRFKNRGHMFHITNNQTIRSIFDLAAHISQFPIMALATREEALKALEAIMLSENLRPTKY